MTQKKQQHKKKEEKFSISEALRKREKYLEKLFFLQRVFAEILADVKNQITDKASELKRADQKKLFLANFPYSGVSIFSKRLPGCIG